MFSLIENSLSSLLNKETSSRVVLLLLSSFLLSCTVRDRRETPTPQRTHREKTRQALRKHLTSEDRYEA